MSEEKFYRCIPELNKECKKNNCYINGGYCEMTICKEYSLKGLLEEIERLNKLISQRENKWEKWTTEKSILSTKMSDYLCKYQNLKREYTKQIKLSTDRKKEVEKLNNIIKIMEKYFELIVDLGYDYDGLNEEDNLKKLIDELCKYASLGRAYNTTETIYVNRDKKYNILHEELKGSDKNDD